MITRAQPDDYKNIMLKNLDVFFVMLTTYIFLCRES